jgi:hypothetical protein
LAPNTAINSDSLNELSAASPVDIVTTSPKIPPTYVTTESNPSYPSESVATSPTIAPSKVTTERNPSYPSDIVATIPIIAPAYETVQSNSSYTSENVATPPMIAPAYVTVESNSSYPSEKSKAMSAMSHQTSTQLHDQDPRTWSTAEVTGWLQSKNIADSLVKIFQHESITGRALLYLSREDMAAMGIRVVDRVELSILIDELKGQWIIPNGNEQHGFVNAASSSSSGSGFVVRMEDGKGAPSTDAPPMYRA